MAPGDKRKEEASAEGRGRGGRGRRPGRGRGGLREGPAPQPARPGAPCRRRGAHEPHSAPPPGAGPRGRPRRGRPRRAGCSPSSSPPEAFNVGFLLEDGYVN